MTSISFLQICISELCVRRGWTFITGFWYFLFSQTVCILVGRTIAKNSIWATAINKGIFLVSIIFHNANGGIFSRFHDTPSGMVTSDKPVAGILMLHSCVFESSSNGEGQSAHAAFAASASTEIEKTHENPFFVFNILCYIVNFISAQQVRPQKMQNVYFRLKMAVNRDL